MMQATRAAKSLSSTLPRGWIWRNCLKNACLVIHIVQQIRETVNHGILGDGGYWVSLQSLKGHIQLGRPALAWSDTGSGWMSMPKLGFQVEQLVDQQAQIPKLLVDDIPHRLALPTHDAGPVKVTSAYGSVDVSFTPVRMDVTHQGYLILTESRVTPVAVGAPVRDYAQERIALQAAITEQYRQQPVACPSSDGLTVLIAGVEFGKNNELVKLLVAIGRLPQEALKTLEHLSGEVSTEKVREWTQNPVDSFQRSDLGKTTDYVADRLGISGWRW